MLIHEYSWHDAVYLADSSDGCGAANMERRKARQIHKENYKSWFIFVCKRSKKPREISLEITRVRYLQKTVRLFQDDV